MQLHSTASNDVDSGLLHSSTSPKVSRLNVAPSFLGSSASVPPHSQSTPIRRDQASYRSTNGHPVRASRSAVALVGSGYPTSEVSAPPAPPLLTLQKAPALLARRKSLKQLFSPHRERSHIAQPELPRPQEPAVAAAPPEVLSRDSPKGYVTRHSNWVTLLLSGQKEGVSELVYYNGGVIEGVIAAARQAPLLRLEVKVEGKMQLQEIAESGTYEVELLKDTVYEWDAGQNIIHPAQTSFRYNLPIHYTHSPTGEQFRLPPSYYADSMSVPGFRVSIKYAIVMHITVAGNKSNWWRKDTLSVRVPFINRDRSQARLVGPFSPIPIKTETGPQTVFKYIIESKEGISQNIDVELYIPNSQVCSVRGPIPFVVTFFAREEILDKYASFHATSGQPCESSHPIDHSDQSGLTNSRQPQQPSVDSTTLPVRMHLLRKTQVDVRATGHASERSTAIWQNKAIATGVVHTVSREYSYAAWSGMISVPEDVLCGGFSAKGIKVTDSLALTIAHPSALRASYYESFFERVPIRLTSEWYESDLSK